MSNQIKKLTGLAKKLNLDLEEVIKTYDQRSYKMYRKKFDGHVSEFKMVSNELDNKCYNLIERYYKIKSLRG